MNNKREDTISPHHRDIREEDISKLLNFLSAVISQRYLYPPSHPILQKSIKTLLTFLNGRLGKGGTISLALIEDQFIIDGKRLTKYSDGFGQLRSELKKLGIEKINFKSGINTKELISFIEAIVTDPKDMTGIDGTNTILHYKGSDHIELKRLSISLLTDIEGYSDAAEIIQKGIDTLKEIIPEVRKDHKINYKGVHEMVYKVCNFLYEKRSPLLAITSFKGYDEYTFTHATNVSTLAMIIGQGINLPQDIISDFGIAGLLHDIGKETIPPEIINKPGKLTEEEFTLIKSHPVNGAKILIENKGIIDLAPIVAYEHHIKFSGGGYPELPRKRDLNLCSMIVSIADVYDALRSTRSYRREFSLKDTIRILKESAKDFEPILLKRFIGLVGIYMVGTIVRLKSGHIGIVYELNPNDPYSPFVRIIKDPNGENIKKKEIIDLSVKEEKGDENFIIDVLEQREDTLL
ncbi:MAG: HD domain-containing protein [Nitrospinae bacterium]|nr:HD domain-containing protein [Nitrospinota bacterium]